MKHASLLFLLGILLLAACAPIKSQSTTITSIQASTPTPESSATPLPSSPTPSASTPVPSASPTTAPQLTIYNRYLGKDPRRQPELIKTPLAPIIAMREAEGYSKSYAAIFLNGKQVNGDDIRGEAVMLAQLNRLFNDAYQAGHTSQSVLSAYRSYDEQVYLKSQNNSTEDEAVAEPGRSEHQLGTAVDLAWNAERLNFYLMTVYPKARDFYNWLKVNAQNYGFVFSYPYKTNTDQTQTNLLTAYVTEYKAEPWHLRYVGPDLAQKIYAAKDANGRNYLDPLSNLIPQQFMLP